MATPSNAAQVALDLPVVAQPVALALRAVLDCARVVTAESAVVLLNSAPLLRAVTVCLACGHHPDEPAPVRCDAHGDELTAVIVQAPAYALGVTRAPAFGSAADLEQLGLVAS